MAQPPRPSTQRRHLLAAPALAAGLAAWAQAAGDSTMAATPAGATAEQFKRLRERMRADALAESGPGAATGMLASQAADGSWKDVDYADRAVGNWRPMAHLERLRRMARALAEPVPPKADMAAALERGLNFWLGRKPRSENWWHNTIGQQRELVRILLLSPDALPPALVKRLLAELVDPSMVPAEQATGQNRVWYASQQIVRGAVAQQAGDVEAGSRAVASTLRITLDEGIQPDLSFHQHGPQLYSGGYGLALLVDVVQVAAWLHELPWALPADALNVLSDYALQGMAPLARGNWFDWSARGREFTRVEHRPLPAQLAAALTRLAPLLPQHRAAIDRTVQALQRGAPAATGTRAFWRSDFLVHHTPQAYFSLKLCSTRTIGTESGNGENLQGFWLPFGVTFLLKRGDEYENLPPVWNWAALPGLTSIENVPPLKGYQTHNEKFVAVLGDNDIGFGTMTLNKQGLQAKRSWFFVGDLMISMGSGIFCNHPYEVFTTLNQCRENGKAVGSLGTIEGQEIPPGTRWIWHDGLTYLLFDDVQNIELRREQRTKQLGEVNISERNSDVTAQVFSLRIRHGKKPISAKYAYGVWAGAPTAETAGNAPLPIVLVNNTAIHAISTANGSIVLAVFYEPSSLRLGSGLTVRPDGPCLICIRLLRDAVDFSLADPVRHSEGINVTMTLPSGSAKTRLVRVPADPSLAYVAKWRIQL